MQSPFDDRTLIAEYCALTVPRFGALQDDTRLLDVLLAQRALWSVLAYQAVVKHCATVELRFGAWGQDQPSFVALRVHGALTSGLKNDLQQIEALLPRDYRWERRGADVGPLSSPVRIARVVRRLEYLDLPSTSPFILQGGAWAATLQEVGASPDAIGSTTATSASILSAGFNGGDGPFVRELPMPETTSGELATRRFCLPVPGPISEWKARLHTLFDVIHRSGLSVVSFCIHPMNEDERLASQWVAMNWQRFLDAFMAVLAQSGFTDVETLRTAFTRFGLPRTNLFFVSIRVAASKDDAAVGVANIVAELLGGARGFRVRAPTRDATLGALTASDLDIPRQSWADDKLHASRRAVQRELLGQGIGHIDNDEILDFLIRMPHVFAMHEVEQIFKLPIADDHGLPGLSSQAVAPFSVPSISFEKVLDAQGHIAVAPLDRVRVGMLERGQTHAKEEGPSRYASFAWHTLNPADLTKHALIVGSTGSGKTMTTLFLVRELARLKIPVLIIEPVKTEYYEALSGLVPGLQRRRLESGTDGRRGSSYLAFDPLRVPTGTSVARHCSYIKSCFEAAFTLTEFLALLLENALRAYYEDTLERGGCGLTKFTRGGPQIGIVREGRVYPSFATFRSYLNVFLDKELSVQTAARGAGDLLQIKEAFRRRFENLGDGLVGECFKRADELYIDSKQHPKAYDVFPAYLEIPLVIELDAVPDADQKALVMAFMLSKLFEHRQAEDFLARESGGMLASGLRHFLILEEAHRLLSTASAASGKGAESVGETSKAKSIQLFVDMLAEVRAFGQGLGIVEQIPTKIIAEALKNTNLKIMLRLTARDDREYLGEAMNFTEEQKAFVTNLKVERGQRINFVVFEEGVEQPLLLSLPLTPTVDQGDVYSSFFEPSQRV